MRDCTRVWARPNTDNLGIQQTAEKQTISMATGTGGPSGEFFNDTFYQYVRINFSQVKV